MVGEEFAVAVVAAGLEQPMETVEATCSELALTERFIRSADIQEWPDGTLGGRYIFQHALYPDVFYARIPDVRCIHLHQELTKRSSCDPSRVATE